LRNYSQALSISNKSLKATIEKVNYFNRFYSHCTLHEYIFWTGALLFCL